MLHFFNNSSTVSTLMPFDLGTCIRSESSCPLAVIKVTAIGLVEVVAEAAVEAVHSVSFVEFSVQLVLLNQCLLQTDDSD